MASAVRVASGEDSDEPFVDLNASLTHDTKTKPSNQSKLSTMMSKFAQRRKLCIYPLAKLGELTRDISPKLESYVRPIGGRSPMGMPHRDIARIISDIRIWLVLHTWYGNDFVYASKRMTCHCWCLGLRRDRMYLVWHRHWKEKKAEKRLFLNIESS